MILAAAAAAGPGSLRAQDRLPPELAGAWRIGRVVGLSHGACYTPAQAQPLLGSTLLYARHSFHWKGGSVPLTGIVTHPVDSNDLKAESAVSGTGQAPDLADLGIRTPTVLEINLQHEDADITGSTTEVPGDTVLLAAPGRIIVSACGVYMEAHRPAK